MYSTKPKNKEPYYPKDSNNVEYYLRNATNKEIYAKHQGIENYAFDPRTKEEVYATDESDQQYYARYDQKEIYAVDLKKDFEKFIRLHGDDHYTRNASNVEFYPLDATGCQKVARHRTHPFYARFDPQTFYYPLDEYGHEYAVEDAPGRCLLIGGGDEPIVPLTRSGAVRYRRVNGMEIAYTHRAQAFVGRNAAGDGQYPLDATQQPYYPDNGTSEPKIARDRRGRSRYALTRYASIRYPLVGADESYLHDEHSDALAVLERHSEAFVRYAKRSDGKEVYPVRVVGPRGQATERMMHDLYAEHDHRAYYPKDSKRNEYSNGTLLEAYPMTRDGYAIIPNHENEPVLRPEDAALSKQIRCLLYRPDFKRYDFLTRCSSKLYPLLHSESFAGVSPLRYVIVALCTVAWILFFILIIK